MDRPQDRIYECEAIPNHPIRNRTTARHAARLMYEIASQQAVLSDKFAEMIPNPVPKPAKLLSRKFQPMIVR